jgi:hypothetical protein
MFIERAGGLRDRAGRLPCVTVAAASGRVYHRLPAVGTRNWRRPRPGGRAALQFPPHRALPIWWQGRVREREHGASRQQLEEVPATRTIVRRAGGRSSSRHGRSSHCWSCDSVVPLL